MSKLSRIVSMLLCITLILGVLPLQLFAVSDGFSNFTNRRTITDIPFTDVQSGDWFYDSVYAAYQLGLMIGTGDNTFDPNGTLTLAQSVTVAARIHAIYTSGNDTFEAAEPWYKPYFDYAQKVGIPSEPVNGANTDTAVSRAVFAVILAAALPDEALSATNEIVDNAIPDVHIDDAYADAVYKLYRAGILTGNDESGTFAPYETLKRSEAAAIVSRMADPTLRQNHTLGTYYTVTFVNDDTATTQTVFSGKTATEPATPKKTDCTFLGWYTIDDKEYDFTTPVTEDIILYARWKKTGTGIILPIIPYPLPIPDMNNTYYTVTFATNGGSSVPSQSVVKGGTPTQPEDPTRDNYTFIGWYYADGFSYLYDFGEPIYNNVTIFAKWFDNNDTSDSDGDGLIDSLEETFGTDPHSTDSDGDGLSDYLELNWLNYNPLDKDSDGNGIFDGDEDFDKDGLTNLEEVHYGTDPFLMDTDNDQLSDYEEIMVYHTDPLNPDTDGDGVIDGVEVSIGSDPLVAETVFKTEVDEAELSELTPVAASAVVFTDSDGAGTLTIDEVSILDNPLLSFDIPGYLGSAYNFTTSGDFLSATLTFTYDTSLGSIGDEFQPRIYYFDEETGLLEELENQTVEEGIVRAEVSHFSSYILLNKVAFDAVWDTEIKPPFFDGDNENATLDIAFVIDYSASMKDNDPNHLFKQVSKDFIAKLREDKDHAAVVKFIKRATLVSALTTDKDALNTAIDSITYDSGYNTDSGTDGSTGIKAALDALGTSESNYQYIVFITDGNDTNTTYSYDTLIETAIDNHVVIYTIGMGNASESILTNIAESTGGKYYHATTDAVDTDDIINLGDVFKDIESSTIDLTTDSNNDGIPDYYTKLLNDGDLLLSNGSAELIGVTDDYGLDSDDWDGDGLKNGEEIKITVSGSRVYAKMISNPLLKDSDLDGLDDFTEKAIGTPPLQYTSEQGGSLNNLENDSQYVYIEMANDRSFVSNINAWFDWNKTDEAEQLYINYFYDYASESTLQANEEAISELEKKKELMKWIKAASNVMSAAKTICEAVDDIKDISGKSEPSQNQKDFVAAVRNKEIAIKGASRQIRRSRKVIYDNLNSKENVDFTKVYSNIVSSTDTMIDLSEDIKDLFESEGIGSLLEDLSVVIKKAASISGRAIKSVKAIKEVIKYKELDNGFKALSRGYKDFLKTKKKIKGSTIFGVALNTVDAGIEIAETCNTFAKMKANRDAYLTYMDLLYYMSEHADEKYDRVAANSVATMIADESWTAYEERLTDVNGKIIAFAVVESFFDVVGDVCAYVKVANMVYKAAKATISVIGLSANAEAFMQCRTIKAISDGCIYIIESRITRSGSSCFSYDDSDAEYITAYITQLAQSRIVGEDYCRQLAQRKTVGSWISRMYNHMSIEEIEELFVEIIGEVYTEADKLTLTLSKKLPYYSKFHNSGSGGGSR